MINLIIFGAGVAVIVFVLTYYAFRFITKLWKKIAPYKNRISEMLSESKKEEESLYLLYGILAGFVFGLLPTIGTGMWLYGMMIGVCGGAIISLIIKKSVEDTIKLKKMKELAVIYETVVFYNSAGYTLQQSLDKSRDLVKLLRPTLDKCLSAWPHGPARAIYSFGDEVECNEAKVLAGIFVHVIEKGASFNEAAIIEESQQLENLRKTLTEMKILNKPLYFAVYRALPLMAVSGIIIGALVNRVIIMLGSIMGI